MMNNKKRKELDKFYTKSEVANSLWGDYSKILKDYNIKSVMEPSAGAGAMLDAIKGYPTLALDICPERDDITKGDFLEIGMVNHHNLAIFGNPPFGRNSKLAIEFLNKALGVSKIVGMILPKSFNRYRVQKNINKNAKLINSWEVPKNSFLLNNKNYNINCVFQVWTLESLRTEQEDLRIKVKPPINHEDFKAYQYNCTKIAEKYFNYDWDIAVLRQGYGDFNKIYTKQDTLARNKQYIFIKANNEEVLNKIKSIDFNKLANKNTQVRGFGKADLVQAYVK